MSAQFKSSPASCWFCVAVAFCFLMVACSTNSVATDRDVREFLEVAKSISDFEDRLVMLIYKSSPNAGHWPNFFEQFLLTDDFRAVFIDQYRDVRIANYEYEWRRAEASVEAGRRNDPVLNKTLFRLYFSEDPTYSGLSNRDKIAASVMKLISIMSKSEDQIYGINQVKWTVRIVELMSAHSVVEYFRIIDGRGGLLYRAELEKRFVDGLEVWMPISNEVAEIP